VMTINSSIEEAERMRNLKIASLCLLATLLMLLAGCGSDGPQGLRGTDGDQGDKGNDYVASAPADQIFSVAIFNGSNSHNGNATIWLTTDSNATVDGNTLIMPKLDRPPMIDGIDDGDAIWGPFSNMITIDRTPLLDNFIRNGKMRAGYDNDFVYFMVQWEEVAQDGFSVGVNAEQRTWTYNSNHRWVRSSTREDRVSLMFFIRGEFFDDEIWGMQGCDMACHAQHQVGMYTLSDTTDLDCWTWGSVTTEPMGYAKDAVVISADEGRNDYRRVIEDQGAHLYFDNVTDTLPLFMHKADPNYNAAYPLTLYKVKGFRTTGWQTGATIPGIVNSYPTFSAADVSAAGHFENGTWTVEFRRARQTKNPDDIQF